MKKILYTLLATAIALISCTDEIGPMDSYSKGNVVLTVYNSTMTKAITDPNGLEYERVLKTLDCFFYEKGGADQGLPCVYYQRLDPVPDNAIDDGRSVIQLNITDDILNKIFPDANTECDVFVIANLPANHEYEADAEGTEVQSLNKTLLEADKNGYDGLDKPFAMAGLDIATKSTDAQGNDSVEGEIPLYRASAKITISVNIPESITAYATKFDGEGNILRDEEGMPLQDAYIMTPVFVENENGSEVVALQTAFHNGVSKTYLNDEYVDAEGKSLIEAADYFFTTKKRYKAIGEIPATGSAPKQYVYTCEVPFYSYARAWERGGDNAAYLSFQMPWKNEATGNYRLYYYQIPINITDNRFAPNHWYDITANIGVLGSTVESQPYLIGEMSFYVLDWTTEPDAPYGDRYEDIVMEKYTYLVVPEKRIEIYNSDTDVIRYEASHKIGLKMNSSSKTVEILGGTTTNSSYYINCSTNPAKIASVPNGISADGNFTIEVDENTNLQTGDITYEYHIPQGNPGDVYSPVFVYFTIWLDFDGDGDLDTNYAANYEGVREDEFVEHVTIVQYPPIYIIPDPSTLRSIYVNKDQSQSSSMNNVDLDGYKLGASTGVKNFDGNNEITNNSMYVINVTAFSSSNYFNAPPLDANGYLNFTDGLTNPTERCYYIIGDPRQHSNAIVDRSIWDRSWAIGEDFNGGEDRTLQYYYPTESTGENFQVIAPKYRIVSFNNASGKNCTPESAAMRCASVQEDGFPAGRWRLPTVAEVRFIIELQKLEVIEDIFLSGSSYYATAAYAGSDELVTLRQNGDNIQWNKRESGISVRCVYDEWYWGSEREAIENPDPEWSVSDINGVTHYGDEYLFTWGDEQIW